MDIIIENQGLEDDEFHAIASGDTGNALRQSAKNYLGSMNIAERQLEELKMQGGSEYEQLCKDMTDHALRIVSLDPSLPVSLEISFNGGIKS
ncbi:hypothetical protein [Aidingimonas halophila]|uniref:Uncharacterized protein n=1 Tax=Aidingimonas halophila TaxID=574349 RepID=A0A1H2SKG0_9GAMM|nr:hypothetical protein [Aidingimonas halophila]GHC17519.1 hypothetical protein GCM10008094_03900 [Aidingimonas halophila]SDW32082.1 hypothetical protein SAMN05443545_101586 [Aidingimonas halophila]